MAEAWAVGAPCLEARAARRQCTHPAARGRPAPSAYPAPPAPQRCAYCGTTSTPVWRTGPNKESLCNKCGLQAARKRRKQEAGTLLELKEGAGRAGKAPRAAVAASAAAAAAAAAAGPSPGGSAGPSPGGSSRAGGRPGGSGGGAQGAAAAAPVQRTQVRKACSLGRAAPLPVLFASRDAAGRGRPAAIQLPLITFLSGAAGGGAGRS